MAEIDLRIGGRFRIGMQAPDNSRLSVAMGPYTEIVPLATGSDMAQGARRPIVADNTLDLGILAPFNVFFKDTTGAIFHTYSAHATGIDMLNGAYHYLDLAPNDRDEEGLDDPPAWVRYHDRYED